MQKEKITIRKQKHVSQVLPLTTKKQGQKQEENLPLLYTSLHGSLPIVDFIPICHLRENEYIICPRWHKFARVCFRPEFQRVLHQVQSLQHLVLKLAETFPKTETEQGNPDFSFQIFDSQKPIPNLNLETDDQHAKGFLKNVGLLRSRKVNFERMFGRNFSLENVISYVRGQNPEGFILVLFLCTSLPLLRPPLRQQQAQQIQQRQRDYNAYSGFPLQDYFSQKKSSLFKQSKKGFQQGIRYFPEFKYPKIEISYMQGGQTFTITYNDQTIIYQCFFLDENSDFIGSSLLYQNGHLIGDFPAVLPRQTSHIKLDLPEWLPFQFFFKPVSQDKNGKLSSPELSYEEIQPLFSIQELTIKNHPWKKINAQKEIFTQALDQTDGNCSFFQVHFLTPFDFSFLIITEKKIEDPKVMIVTQENRIFNLRDISLRQRRFSYAEPSKFILSEIMNHPNNFSHITIIGTNPVAIFFLNFKIEPLPSKDPSLKKQIFDQDLSLLQHFFSSQQSQQQKV